MAGAPRTRPGSALTSSGNAIANRATVGGVDGNRRHINAAAIVRNTATATPSPDQLRIRTNNVREVGNRCEAVAPPEGRRAPASIDASSSSRSIRRSFALWYRRSGSFASARRTTRPRSPGSAGLSSVIGFGVSFKSDEMIAMLVAPVNGRWPVAIS
jgi:hypothetical protein